MVILQFLRFGNLVGFYWQTDLMSKEKAELNLQLQDDIFIRDGRSSNRVLETPKTLPTQRFVN
jgi:hypothetical protein